MKVRGGAVHVLPGGRHTMIIGETPGARTAGLVEAGAEGHGNCSATISVPIATWRVVPLCAGVIVIVPCAVLGAEAGGLGWGDDGADGEAGRDGADELDGADEDGLPEAEPPCAPESEGVLGGDCDADPEALPGPVPDP